MSLLELAFASKEDSLSVRRFAVHEAMSSLFSVSIWARSPNDDIDLETLVGQPASFRAVSGVQHAARGVRSWSGVCSQMELVHAESTGLSTYYLRIVPKLWLSTQRVNNRIFQHQSAPDIVEAMLGEWAIERELKVEKKRYPKLELRAQYGESDFDFMNRLLEEAGISYYFADGEEAGKESRLVLHDAPQSNELRAGGPIGYVDNPSQAAEKEFLSGVRLSQRVRPGKVTLRDYDFRRQPKFKFFGNSSLGKGVEELLEVYRYEPGGFLVELEEQGADALKDLAAAGKVLPKVPGLPSVPGLPGMPKVPGMPQVPGMPGAPGTPGIQSVKKTFGAGGAPGAGSGGEKGGGASGGAGGGGLKGKAASAAGGAAQGYVEKKVGGLVEDTLEKVAGEKAAKLVGGLAGGMAGEVAGKVAGFVAGEVAGKLQGALGGVLGKLVGDDKGMARFSEKAGIERAARALESARASRRTVTFESNVMDLAPGSVFSIGKHSRSDLSGDKPLLVTESSFEGTHDGEWSQSAQAAFGDAPYRPPMKTPKPTIQGLQSAVVVGPPGEEIHTDEFGRVRVQFHWDREGGFDEGSSCWMRVSQGWAGSGFGMIALPRVGQEVLVAFLEGNPDHPVVVGRLFNATSPVPYDLPANKTKSGWKSDSTPGSGGFNEIMFEDAKGREMVYVQAERDLEKLVKRNEAIAVGNDRRTSVGAVDESHIGVRYNVTMQPGEVGGGEGNGASSGPTFFEMVDKRIHLSTGEASITLDGPNITLAAKGRIFIHSSDDDVEILGGPWVKINCGPAGEEGDTVTSHHITGIVRDQDGKPVPDMKVVVKASDGSIQQVATDSSGRYFALVPPGKCQVSLPGTCRYGTSSVNLDEMSEEPEEFDDSGPVV